MLFVIICIVFKLNFHFFYFINYNKKEKIMDAFQQLRDRLKLLKNDDLDDIQIYI